MVVCSPAGCHFWFAIIFLTLMPPRRDQPCGYRSLFHRLLCFSSQDPHTQPKILARTPHHEGDTHHASKNTKPAISRVAPYGQSLTNLPRQIAAKYGLLSSSSSFRPPFYGGLFHLSLLPSDFAASPSSSLTTRPPSCTRLRFTHFPSFPASISFCHHRVGLSPGVSPSPSFSSSPSLFN